MSKKNETRYRNAMQMIRDGKTDEVITQLTGFSKAVINAMRIDVERDNHES